ncbi:MAG TPA: hypothetical protein VFU72_01760 [Nitrolancea sp.]|nr:hypothetical protein [Nitrolancea sp.]
MAITKANYLKANSAGVRDRLARSIRYYTWRGSGERAGRRTQPRGWVRDDGRALPWLAVRDCAGAEVAVYRYCYRIVLSTRETPLGFADYQAALGTRFARWYLVQHHDGGHPHAHVIAFTERRLGRGDLAGQRARLLAREQSRAQSWGR